MPPQRTRTTSPTLFHAVGETGKQEMCQVSRRYTYSRPSSQSQSICRKTLPLFSLLHMLLFRAFKTNMADAQKWESLSSVNFLNFNMLQKMRDVLTRNHNNLVSPCDLAWLARTFQVQIVAAQQASRPDARLNPSL